MAGKRAGAGRQAGCRRARFCLVVGPHRMTALGYHPVRPRGLRGKRREQVNVGQVAEGLGLAVFGVAFYACSRWYAGNDRLMRLTAQRRWWFDRWLIRKVRRGEMTRDEWFARFIRNRRAFVKWALTPFVALWVALCMVVLVRGLLS